MADGKLTRARRCADSDRCATCANGRQGSAGREALQAGASVYRRVGHKGADAITEGNTIESFEAAVERGVDMIEFDVLRDREGRLVSPTTTQDAAHAAGRWTLTEALDAFLEPPLDQVEIDCDLKLPGREAELAGALAGHGLVERAMVSTMEIESLRKLRQLEPDLRLGWTYPEDPPRLDPVRLGGARRRRRAGGDAPPLPEDAAPSGPPSWTSTPSGPTTRSSPRSWSRRRRRPGSS